jgi:hypothetical protein
LPRSLSWLAGVLSTLPNPSWLDPGASASERAQHLSLQTPTSHQAKKRFWSTLWWSGMGKGRISCICCRMHLTFQARYLHCSGCHFELKQVGFTAAYRALQCLLTSRITFISILRAGLLQPHGSESGTWHNRDLIQRHACADVSPWASTKIQNTCKGRTTGRCGTDLVYVPSHAWTSCSNTEAVCRLNENR